MAGNGGSHYDGMQDGWVRYRIKDMGKGVEMEWRIQNI